MREEVKNMNNNYIVSITLYNVIIWKHAQCMRRCEKTKKKIHNNIKVIQEKLLLQRKRECKK